MTRRITYNWLSDPAGHGGELTLLPESKDALKIRLSNFTDAHGLGRMLERIEREAFDRGRESVFEQIARLK